MPRYSRPAMGACTVPSAPMKKGVAASLLPMRPTRAPRPALGTISARKVSTHPRAAPSAVMPVVVAHVDGAFRSDVQLVAGLHIHAGVNPLLAAADRNVEAGSCWRRWWRGQQRRALPRSRPGENAESCCNQRLDVPVSSNRRNTPQRSITTASRQGCGLRPRNAVAPFNVAPR